MQFGVKFTIMYKVCYYVDGVCQLYLHHLIYFENRKFFIFGNHFIILSLYIYFQGKIISFLIWIYDLGKPF